MSDRPTRPRDELIRRVQSLDRAHPDWDSPRIEKELETLVPVLYGNWKDDTPNPASRSRQIQRWRGAGGVRTLTRGAKPLYHRIWPIGERQRQALQPSFTARPTRFRASHRVFLHNCSTETLREIRVRLGTKDVGFEPALTPGSFAEVAWYKNDEVRSASLDAPAHAELRFALGVEFAITQGTRRARLDGELIADSSDGWTAFRSAAGGEREIA
ncbi:MAG: hypothetical protein L3K15_04265 [Thermoplasmata archaeon]|nr:hypothetical protein [Thermoplasmata archaeon]